MSDDLEKQKTQLEIEKLKAEINALKHPFIHNPGYFVTVIFATAALVTALINWNSVKTKERLDHELVLLKNEIDQKNLEKKQIEDEMLSITDEASNLRAANELIRQMSKLRGNLTEEEQSLVSKAKNANYLIAYISLNVPESEHESVEDLLRINGFNILRKSSMLDTAPEWFSKSPTVYYYDDRAKDKAKEIAQLLEVNTGVKFTVAKGAGKGIERERERWTIVIHQL